MDANMYREGMYILAPTIIGVGQQKYRHKKFHFIAFSTVPSWDLNSGDINFTLLIMIIVCLLDVQQQRFQHIMCMINLSEPWGHEFYNFDSMPIITMHTFSLLDVQKSRRFSKPFAFSVYD